MYFDLILLNMIVGLGKNVVTLLAKNLSVLIFQKIKTLNLMLTAFQKNSLMSRTIYMASLFCERR